MCTQCMHMEVTKTRHFLKSVCKSRNDQETFFISSQILHFSSPLRLVFSAFYPKVSRSLFRWGGSFSAVVRNGPVNFTRPSQNCRPVASPLSPMGEKPRPRLPFRSLSFTIQPVLSYGYLPIVVSIGWLYAIPQASVLTVFSYRKLQQNCVVTAITLWHTSLPAPSINFLLHSTKRPTDHEPPTTER